jgi:hypothetical protein
VADLDVLTLDEAKAALNLGGSTRYDAELPAWITAVSGLLDSRVGPVVQRDIEDEAHDGSYGVIWVDHWPVAEFTEVTEYAYTTATILTAETNITKPDAGYFAERYAPDPTLYSGRLWRRAGGSASYFAVGSGNVVVSYTAGRYADTEAVGERFKTAARLMLQNLWASQRPNLGEVGEFEAPQSLFPRFSIPNAAKELLAGEWQGGLLVG